ncbi:MAG: M48 family metalloprotease, partial [Bdellovibrio sp.]
MNFFSKVNISRADRASKFWKYLPIVKRSSQSLFACLFFLSSGVSAAPASTQAKDSSLAKIWTEDPKELSIEKLRSRYLRDQLRSPLDRAVRDLLRENPEYERLFQELEHSLKLQASDYAKQHLYSMPQANGQQYSWFLDLTRDMARRMSLPKSQVDGLVAFVDPSPVMNAYTYTSEGTTHVVGFKELLDRMDREAIRSVFAHELGHVLSHHVVMNMALQVIFDTSFKILVPEEPDDLTEVRNEKESAEKMQIRKLKHKELRAVLKESLESETRESLHHMISGVGEAHAMNAAQEALLEGYMKTAQNFSQKLSSGNAYQRAEVIRLAEKLFAVLTETPKEEVRLSLQKQIRLLKSGEGGEGDIGTKKELMKKFQQAMQRFSRAAEQTCDNHGIVYAGVRPTQNAFASLMGGTPEGILSQMENQVNDPFFIESDFRMAEGSSHPGISARVRYPDVYSRSLEYKVLSDLYLRSVDFYFEASADLAKARQDLTRVTHPFKIQALDIKMKNLGPYLQSLQTILIEETLRNLEQVKTPQAFAESAFGKLIEYLGWSKEEDFRSPFAQRLQERQRFLDGEMGRQGRFLFDLAKAIEQDSRLPEGLRNAYIEALSDHFNPSQTWRAGEKILRLLREAKLSMGS